jgi:LPXTG-motif cell wall-anchored protein
MLTETRMKIIPYPCTTKKRGGSASIHRVISVCNNSAHLLPFVLRTDTSIANYAMLLFGLSILIAGAGLFFTRHRLS